MHLFFGLEQYYGCYLNFKKCQKIHFFSKKSKNSSAPTRNLIVSVPMFWSTGNHWGLQEDIHYCPNVTCWCVNCQLICMQKLHQFPVCFIYEESLPIDMSTGPNAVDVSTVSSFVCRRSTFRLFPVCFIPHFYFLAISQNCHSTQNYEIILKN